MQWEPIMIRLNLFRRPCSRRVKRYVRKGRRNTHANDIFGSPEFNIDLSFNVGTLENKIKRIISFMILLNFRRAPACNSKANS